MALTRDGASERGVLAAKEAIEARTDLTPAEQADHLAVLWFIGEAEDVPVRVMKEYITEEKLMASSLYQSIYEKGEARGEAKARAATLVEVLTLRVGELDPAVAARIRSVQSSETLRIWLSEALSTADAESARRLIEKIGKVSAS